ncbi:FBD-associated F-box protein [Corchorus olitorius]|uniref:FBD-associated F-box protein n=1 Tax=Corchorus olitorius TaxID=93759 RepID=A0A1R3KFK7_9ROSI|nr:FBD-associated F-box protein [Corchorus olitorius]
MSLPHSLFTCESLTSLKLTFTQSKTPEIEFPTSVWLPSLKTLRIENSHNAEKILPGCPVLEEFHFKLGSYSYNCRNISIANASLQRLIVKGFMQDNYSASFLVINCPNLRSLKISWHNGDIKVCELYSLVKADIAIDCRDHWWETLRGRRNPRILELLESIRHVKSLELSRSTLEGIHFDPYREHKEMKSNTEADELAKSGIEKATPWNTNFE